MNTGFSYKSFAYTLIFGLIFVVGFAWLTGPKYATALLPTMAMLSGFIVTGVVIGLLSEGVTIVEPGVGSVIVSVIAYMLVPNLELMAFEEMTDPDWVILLLNGSILTFLGAWLGEKIQNGVVGQDEITESKLDWSWILAGTVLGVTVSLVIVNIMGIQMFNPPWVNFVPFFAAIFLTGVVVGWMSPGITITEAGLAGFLTLTIDINIVHFTLMPMDFSPLIIGIVLGFIITFAGGAVGEKVQAAREAKQNS